MPGLPVHARGRVETGGNNGLQGLVADGSAVKELVAPAGQDALHGFVLDHKYSSIFHSSHTIAFVLENGLL